MRPKTTEAPIWGLPLGLPDVAQVIALKNGAIHYNPVTSMKSVWASPRWKISFSSTA